MKNNRISYYYINNNNMTNNTKRTKKPCKRGKKSRTTLKRSFKKRGGSVKKQRSRAKTPAAPSSVKKRNQRNHIYEKVTNYSPTPYARLHGKKKTLKKNKGSPVYDNLQRVKGPVQPGTDTLLDNEIAEGKRGMKLKGGVNDDYAHLPNKKKSSSKPHYYNVLNPLNRRPHVDVPKGHVIKKVEIYEKKINPKKSKPHIYNEKGPWNVSPKYEIPQPHKTSSLYAEIPYSNSNKKPSYVLGNNNNSRSYLVPGYQSEQRKKLATYATPPGLKIPTPYAIPQPQQKGGSNCVNEKQQLVNQLKTIIAENENVYEEPVPIKRRSPMPPPRNNRFIRPTRPSKKALENAQQTGKIYTDYENESSEI